MGYQWIFGFLFLLITLCNSEKNSRSRRRFPDGFLFGTATASYQVEGAWDEDGKTPNIWDHLTHTYPEKITDNSNGDIADDSYHLYERDVEMMRELGIDFYRFSLSWTRIMPTSFPDKINEAGVEYYNNLINELLKHNIEPMVTIFHWDLPQKLQEMGGWTNPHIVDWFSDYARTVYTLFGDRVKHWMTFNEPHAICYYGYGSDDLAPALNIKGIAEYMCAKNLLLAHANAYHIYQNEFKPTQNGMVFVAFSAQWYEPHSEEDIQAAEDANMFTWGQYVHPIYSETGDFPPVMKERIAARSAEQGYDRSHLIALTPEEVEYIRGTSDIFGLNHYYSFLVYRNESVIDLYDSPSFRDDLGVVLYQKPEWVIGESDAVKTTPWGFYNLLTKIKNDYNNPIVYITENGYSSPVGLEDNDRVTHVNLYLDAMLDAIEDGANVKAYTAWSLMDNFEWMAGYTNRFGLYEVDYTDPNRTRTPRKSAFMYKELIRTKELNFDYEPDYTAPMTIDEGH